MTAVTTGSGITGWTSFVQELVCRITSEWGTLLRAMQSGDELQVQVSRVQLEDLYDMADRHEIARTCLP